MSEKFTMLLFTREFCHEGMDEKRAIDREVAKVDVRLDWVGRWIGFEIHLYFNLFSDSKSMERFAQ